MKGRFFSFVFLLLVFSSVLSVFVFAWIVRSERSAAVNGKAENEQSSILILGLDEAGENTDVLMVANFDADGNAVLLQIPRDTYIKNELGEGKINRLYKLYTQKYGSKEGADKFLSCMQDAFSIPVRYYAVFSGDNLSSLVDTVGGVSLHVPHSFECTDEGGETFRIEKGKQTLDGKRALAYVRHRASYAEGDLGRLDAQMRFVAALLERIFKEKSVRAYWQIYQKNYRNLLTNVEEKDIINLITMYLKSKDHLSVKLMRLPGEALKDEHGVWYYVLNKNGAASMLSEHLLGASPTDFDREKRFVREDVLAFENIYHAKQYDARIYTLDEASRAEVLHK